MKVLLFKPKTYGDLRAYKEPENPIFLRDLSVGEIELLAEDLYFSHSEPRILNLLLPEQIYILRCHAYYNVMTVCFKPYCRGIKEQVLELAKQEIEPGMFKNEDTL
jgi:hypothetical protein